MVPGAPSARAGGALYLEKARLKERAARRTRREAWGHLFFWLILSLSYTLAGCAAEKEPEEAAPGRTWTNPVTGVRLEMPLGWRSSPAHARKGEKSIGFFKPKPQGVLASAYTHVSLHYEEIAAEGGMSLDAFTGNFSAVIKSWNGAVGAVETGHSGAWQWSRFEAEVPLEGRQPQRMQARIWTADQRHYWYAVVEAPLGDTLTAVRAEPLIELLQGTFTANDGTTP